jgi:hypothetical protein
MLRPTSNAPAAGIHLVAGGYIVVEYILYGHYFYLRGIGMAIIFIGIGGVWLWADFISPLFHKETPSKQA